MLGETKETKGLSRRSFLALGSVAALGAAAMTVGCGTPKTATTSENTTEGTDEVTLKTPDETMECDVCVIGAGGAGMWAAVEAARAGKTVIVVEKASNVGYSNGSNAGGPFMVGSRLQNEAGITFGFEEAFTHIMDFAHWSINAPVVKRCVELSGDTIDRFTDEFGVPTGLRPDNYGAGYASVRANFKNDQDVQMKGEDRMKPLQEWVEGKGGQFVFDTTGKTLVKEDDAIVGIQCDQGGQVIEVRAKATLICTGGFLGNADLMLEKYGTHVNPLGNTLSTGEGIEAVLAAGGVCGTQWGIAGNEFGGSNQNSELVWARDNSAYAFGIYGTLLVNHAGRRFANEGKFANLPLAIGGAISLAGGSYYSVVDQAYVDGLNSGVDAWTYCGADEVNWHTGMMTLKDMPLVDLQTSIDAAVEEGWVFKADTIEALAEAIGCPDLTETVTEYSAACEAGVDDKFYKPACFLQPVATGPFYALQYEPSAWVTIGGIRTNDRLQAIDGTGAAIKGLYVAGADNGSTLSAPYCDYEGTSLMTAYSSGRLAGMWMAEDIDAQ